MDINSLKSFLLEPRANGRPLSIATGFFLDSEAGPLLITNRHVVTGRDNNSGTLLSPTGAEPEVLRIRLPVANEDQGFLRWCYTEEPLSREDGSATWFEHPTLGERADIVALPITKHRSEDGEEFFALPHNLSEAQNMLVDVAETVSVVGFPFGIQGGEGLAIWATGFVASHPHFSANGLPIFYIDCRSRPGQSGSPVIARRPNGYFVGPGMRMPTGNATRFMGAYSGRIHRDSDLGIVWNASAIAQLARSVEHDSLAARSSPPFPKEI